MAEHRQLLPAAGSLRTRLPGSTSTFFTSAAVGGSSCEPSAIQAQHGAGRQRARGGKRTPPSWATRPSALSSTRLASGSLLIGAPAEHVVRQLHVIGGGIVAAQAELEAVLAAGRAVAGTLIAAADVERGDHLIAEADRLQAIRRR